MCRLDQLSPYANGRLMGISADTARYFSAVDDRYASSLITFNNDFSKKKFTHIQGTEKFGLESNRKGDYGQSRKHLQQMAFTSAENVNPKVTEPGLAAGLSKIEGRVNVCFKLKQ